jgi:hypothetical protein
MAGHPGTVRFGENPKHDTDTTEDTGISTLHTNSGDVTEIHQMINPGLRARDMGTSEGDRPNSCYNKEVLKVEYPSNHDGFTGGMLHNLNLDEKKVIDNFVNSVPVQYADEQQFISGSRGKFD